MFDANFYTSIMTWDTHKSWNYLIVFSYILGKERTQRLNCLQAVLLFLLPSSASTPWKGVSSLLNKKVETSELFLKEDSFFCTTLAFFTNCFRLPLIWFQQNTVGKEIESLWIQITFWNSSKIRKISISIYVSYMLDITI